MNKEIILEKLNTIFQDVFDDENLIITESTKADDIEEWDSLTNVMIILSIENEFSIKFDIIKASEMKNVGDMINHIMEKLS